MSQVLRFIQIALVIRNERKTLICFDGVRTISNSLCMRVFVNVAKNPPTESKCRITASTSDSFRSIKFNDTLSLQSLNYLFDNQFNALYAFVCICANAYLIEYIRNQLIVMFCLMHFLISV